MRVTLNGKANGNTSIHPFIHYPYDVRDSVEISSGFFKKFLTITVATLRCFLGNSLLINKT